MVNQKKIFSSKIKYQTKNVFPRDVERTVDTTTFIDRVHILPVHKSRILYNYLYIIEQLQSQNFGTVKIIFEKQIRSLSGVYPPFLFPSQNFPGIGLQIRSTNFLVYRPGLGPLDGPSYLSRPCSWCLLYLRVSKEVV